MVVDDVCPALQGFDAGEECYQEPPADGSGYNVDVDPDRSETWPSLQLTIYTSVSVEVHTLQLHCLLS